MTTPSHGLDDARAGVAHGGTVVGSVATDTVVIDPAISEQYRVVETIAPGPEDALYLARRLDTGAPVELRVLSGGLGADRVLVAAVLQHATLVSRVSSQHPGIAGPHECERTGRGLVLVMERPDGPTLREVIKHEGTLGLQRALGLALRLARVLEQVHTLGLVHGGLRPENIVLAGPAEEITLTHFGFDWVLRSRSPGAGERQLSPPEHPPYLAPEQGWDQVSPRSDIYAFGAILYEMLAGTPPPAVGESRLRISAGSLKNCRADVTPALERVVMQALQVAPERRPPDLVSVIDALTTEMSTDPRPGSAEDKVGGDSSSAGRIKKMLLWGGVSLLGVLAIWFAHTRVASYVSSGVLPRSTSSPAPAADKAPPADKAVTDTAKVDPPEPGVGPGETPGAPAPGETASSSSRIPSKGSPVEQPAHVGDGHTPQPNVPTVPTVVPARAGTPAIAPRKPAASPPTVPSAAAADGSAAARRQAEPAVAPEPQPSRETRDTDDDPGAIIDWLLKEGASKER